MQTPTTQDLKSKIIQLLKEDEEFRYTVAGLIGLQEILKRLDQHQQQLIKLRQDLNKLREDMIEGFKLVERHISALGARWGLLSEEAFREGLKGVLEDLGLKVEKWTTFDHEGKVHGYPSEVEVDVVVKDGKLMIIEVSSHIRASDIYQLKRKAELYQEKTGRKPDKLMAITPYADKKAVEAAEKLGVEVYTRV